MHICFHSSSLFKLRTTNKNEGGARSAPSLGCAAEGGALFLHRHSVLYISDSELSGNLVSGALTSNGGAISALTDSNVMLQNTVLRGNLVANGARDSRGGAMFMWLGQWRSRLQVRNATFVDNAAEGGGLSSTGGALYADEGVVVDMEDCRFHENRARGSPEARAGARVGGSAAEEGGWVLSRGDSGSL